MIPVLGLKMSKRSDDIFDDELGRHWIKVIGRYGDPIRASIINPIVVHTANHFAHQPLKRTELAPQNLIANALDQTASTLWKKLDGIEGDYMAVANDWHSNASQIKAQYQHLDTAVVWDLGCGEGYLGRWLASLGAAYVGTEPSRVLLTHATSQSSSKTVFYPWTIKDFLKKVPADAAKPSLVTMIAVLDGCADPVRTVRDVGEFLRARGWHDVPLLVTTFDPDYFAPHLPRAAEQPAKIKLLGREHLFSVRDPARWEMIFADNDLLVIDQRPIHLNMLPLTLGSMIVDRCEEEIRFAENPADRIPPRQGPFYLWVLAPRHRRKAEVSDARRVRRAAKLNPPPRGELVTFEPDEVIDLKGNLGSKVYEIFDGAVRFKYANLFDMNFPVGTLFGQMEVGRNYFASRLLGSTIASEKALVRSFHLHDVAILPEGETFVSQLFFSMIGHLDSVSYSRLLNSKHVSKEDNSKPLPSLAATSVRNCAAFLLRRAAIATAGHPNAYKSRVLLHLSYRDLQMEIYHDFSTRRDTGLLETLDLFVRANLIDCFSGPVLGTHASNRGVQDDIYDIDEDDLLSQDFVHIGLLVARYIIGAVTVVGDPPSLRVLAIAISAFLGSTVDEKYLLKEITDRSEASARDKDVDARDVKAVVTERSRSIRGVEAKKKFIIAELSVADAQQSTAVSRLLDQMRLLFNFKATEKYQTRGFSNLIVIRDVWALLACAMDDAEMWQDATARESLPDFPAYVAAGEQRTRLIAYCYECIGHLAGVCGLSS